MFDKIINVLANKLYRLDLEADPLHVMELGVGRQNAILESVCVES